MVVARRHAPGGGHGVPGLLRRRGDGRSLFPDAGPQGDLLLPAEELPAGALGGHPGSSSTAWPRRRWPSPSLTPSTWSPSTGCAWARSSPSSPGPSSSSCSVPPRSTCSAASTRWPSPPALPSWSPWSRAHLFSGSSHGVRHAQLLGLALGSGAMVIIAASYLAIRTEVDPGSVLVVRRQAAGLAGGALALGAVRPLWHGLLRDDPGRSTDRRLRLRPEPRPGPIRLSVYLPGVGGLALLELVVLLGLVYASVERFGRRLLPLLERHTLDRWRQDPACAPAGVGPPRRAWYVVSAWWPGSCPPCSCTSCRRR